MNEKRKIKGISIPVNNEKCKKNIKHILKLSLNALTIIKYPIFKIKNINIKIVNHKR
jgi:hypothetical protein